MINRSVNPPRTGGHHGNVPDPVLTHGADSTSTAPVVVVMARRVRATFPRGRCSTFPRVAIHVGSDWTEIAADISYMRTCAGSATSGSTARRRSALHDVTKQHNRQQGQCEVAAKTDGDNERMHCGDRMSLTGRPERAHLSSFRRSSVRGQSVHDLPPRVATFGNPSVSSRSSRVQESRSKGTTAGVLFPDYRGRPEVGNLRAAHTSAR